MEPQPPFATPAPAPPDYRVQSPESVTWATFLGTPAAGGIVLALNYWKWHQKGLAAAAVAGGLLVTAILGWLAWVLPLWIPAVVFLVPPIVGAYFVAKRLQGRRVDAHVAGGGKRASNWVGAGIGLAIFVPVATAFVTAFMVSGVNPSALVDTQEYVDMGHDQYVCYTRGSTRDDAHHFGRALEEYGYLDGTMPADVLITGKAGFREISFLGAEGTWDDEANVQWIKDMAEEIAPAIGGKPVTVRLLDEDWNEKKRLRLE
jgi:hypothetical protein